MPKKHVYWIFIFTLISFACYCCADRFAISLRFIMNEVNNRALHPRSKRELFDSMLSGMMSGYNDFSNYFPPQPYAQFNEDLYQNVEGVGAEIFHDETKNQFIIGCALPDSPAANAGLLSGDVILALDNVPIHPDATRSTPDNTPSAPGTPDAPNTLGAPNAPDDTFTPPTLSDVRMMLRGKVGSTLKMEIFRPSTMVKREFTLVRDVFHVESVVGFCRNSDATWQYVLPPLPPSADGATAGVSKKIVYIRIRAIANDTPAELRRLLRRFRAEEMQGLVLDLRGNAGGFVDSAVAICNMFMKGGTVYTSYGRDDVLISSATANKERECRDIPIAILIDGGTASASELIAACLKDYGEMKKIQVVCVGTRTFGKGTVQDTLDIGPLPDDRYQETTRTSEGLWRRIWRSPQRGGISISVAEYRSPLGKKIQRYAHETESDVWGVTPSAGYEVKMSKNKKTTLFREKLASGLLSDEVKNIYQFDPQLQAAVEFFSTLSPP
ncbi:MAG: S41 family peptidase [Planctomycetia bacterium]|nr:S41 family peptidase [Planctomycetia bacterium]